MRRRTIERARSRRDRQKLEEMRRGLAAVGRGALELARALTALRECLIKTHASMVANITAEIAAKGRAS